MKRLEIHNLLGCGLGLLALAALSAPAAAGGVVDGCASSSSCWAGAIIVCPAGDGHQLSDQGATIFVTVKDLTGNPVSSIPAEDFWLIGCNSGMSLCGGSSSINADAITDNNGQTTISGAIHAGGCDTGVSVVVQGVILTQPPGCSQLQCHPIEVRSPDVNGDLVVDLVDFSLWGPSFLASAAPACHDLNYDGVVDVVDFSLFGSHFLHTCL